MTQRRVTTAHQASYDAPIEVRQGEPLVLSGREFVWDGHRWLWAAAPDGREGWIPDDLPHAVGGQVTARRDYSAVELTCAANGLVSALWQTHGWTWCRTGDGREGWLPDRNLGPADDGG